MSGNEMPGQSDPLAHMEAVRQKSQAVWGEMAPGWYARRDELWEFARPISEWLIDRLDPKPGDTVLELAAGVGETGFLAARKIGQQGRLISTDFAPEMVAAARQRATELDVRNVEFRVLDAERMDLTSNSVDGVLCRWGYMLMVDPAAAFAETRRVLRSGGRLAFSVFAAPERNQWASLVGRVLVKGAYMTSPGPTTPGIFALADLNRIRELVTRAGFIDPQIEEMALVWRFASDDGYWRFLLEAAGAISPILRSLSPEAQTAVRAQLQDAARPYQSGDGYDFPAAVINVVAH